MKVNIPRLLEFFDEAPDGTSVHATSLASLVGEEISVALFQHYLVNQRGAIVELLDGTPTTGMKKGNWLDKWIKVDFPVGERVLFQAEVKSWSAHAIHGKPLKIKADPTTLREYKVRHWQTFWDPISNTFYPKWKSLSKVLIQMRRPSGISSSYEQKPLLIYWMAIHPEGSEECCFVVQVGHPPAREAKFRELTVFSVSAYLRTLQGDCIALDLPNIGERKRWLNEFFAEESAGT